MAEAAKHPAIERLSRVLLVGLGNPGSRYAQTRHNAGFFVIDEVARRASVSLSSKRFDALLGDAQVQRKRAFLLEPQTFMNLSGRSVAEALRYLSIDEGGLVVVHDDVDLPYGRIRMKWAGSDGGHNGLRSIDDSLGHEDYFRIRIGVGRPARGTVKNFVLGGFDSAEREGLEAVVGGGVEGIDLLLAEGLKPAQNRIHGKVFWQPAPSEGVPPEKPDKPKAGKE